MRDVHTIRLRKPWQTSIPEGNSSAVVRHTRQFHMPTGLEVGELVHLVVEPQRLPAVVYLNGKPLGNVSVDGPAACFDVTALLHELNTLEISLQGEAVDSQEEPAEDGEVDPTDGPITGVRLEIGFPKDPAGE